MNGLALAYGLLSASSVLVAIVGAYRAWQAGYESGYREAMERFIDYDALDDFADWRAQRAAARADGEGEK